MATPPASEQQRPHGANLIRKAKSDAALKPLVDEYSKFVTKASSLTINSKGAIQELVTALNQYRRVAVYVLEDRDNSGQENLRSTILEEMFCWLFKDCFKGQTQPTNFFLGKAMRSYISLTFAPHSFSKMFDTPNAVIHTKDQDFVLGSRVTIGCRAASSDSEEGTSEPVVIPAVAIESKVYLAKNHLDACAATATRLKTAMPYCMYLVAAEFLKMDEDVAPELTDISEVFVFCRAANGERQVRRASGKAPHDIDAGLVYDCYEMIHRHLNAIWWNPADALKRGKVIGRPA
jgi:hypothetical protein